MTPFAKMSPLLLWGECCGNNEPARFLK